MKIKEIILYIIALICLIYGGLIYSIQSGTATFLMWIFLAILFLGMAIGIHFDIWRKLPAVLRRMVTVGVALALILFATVEGCIISGFFAQGEEGLDYIIVLGAQVYENGPSNVLKYRLDKACAYLMDNENTICIVSGGQGANEPFSEAQGMYDYLIEKGIPAERILKEEASSNTVENITNSSQYFDVETDSVGIVTNNFHVFRGVHLAQKLGIKNVCGLAAGINEVYLPNNMLREFFGVMKDFVCGNL